MRLKRNFAYLAAIAIFLNSLSVMSACAANQIKQSKYLADNSGTLNVTLNDNHPVSVKIEKNTPDGVFVYYDTVLGRKGTYAFTLDSCEYDIYDDDYDSSFSFIITDEADGLCSCILSDKVVIDPGFSANVSSTVYNVNIISSEAAERNITSYSEPAYVTDNVLQETINLKMDYISYTLGDVNSDGNVNIQDATEILKYYAKISSGMDAAFTDGTSLRDENAAFSAADVTGNSKIGIDDATAVLKYYAMMSAGMDASWD